MCVFCAKHIHEPTFRALCMHWWKTPQTSKFFASKPRMKTGFLTRFLVQPRLCSPLLGLPNFSGAVGPPWRFVDLHPWSWHTIYDLWSICICSYNTCTTPFDHKLFFKWCAMPMTIPFVIVVDWQILPAKSIWMNRRWNLRVETCKRSIWLNQKFSWASKVFDLYGPMAK